MKKICQRCSAGFYYREDRSETRAYGRIYIVAEVRDYIRETYNGCLCPECTKDICSGYYSFGVNPAYQVRKGKKA